MGSFGMLDKIAIPYIKYEIILCSYGGIRDNNPMECIKMTRLAILYGMWDS